MNFADGVYFSTKSLHGALGSVANRNREVESCLFCSDRRLTPSLTRTTRERDQSDWTDYGPVRQTDASEFDERALV